MLPAVSVCVHLFVRNVLCCTVCVCVCVVCVCVVTGCIHMYNMSTTLEAPTTLHGVGTKRYFQEGEDLVLHVAIIVIVLKYCTWTK